MSTEDNKAIARRFVQVWGNGDFNMITDELASPNISIMYPPFPASVRGKESFKKILARFRTAFPDSNVHVEEEIAEGNRVVISWSISGTHSGAFMNIPPTGKKLEWTGISIYKIREGKVTEEKGQEDTLGVLRQMGALPQSQAH